MSDEVIESTGTDVEVLPASDEVNLFRSTKPEEIRQEAADIAKTLKQVVKDGNLSSNIQGKEFLRVEAWQTLGFFMKITPVCEWSREIEDGYKARVAATAANGQVIGAAEAVCLRTEDNWKTRPAYALLSMAQTRATSKALSSVLRWIVTMAGYSGTPFEEMDGVKPRQETKQKPQVKPSEKMLDVAEKMRLFGIDISTGDLQAAVDNRGLPKAEADLIKKMTELEDDAEAASAVFDESEGQDA